ncbi:MAG: hypothetical protein MST10_09950 [Lentisphaeria bacterium]|nr:hypothetical protein [Lentisphaeria bacterium]
MEKNSASKPHRLRKILLFTLGLIVFALIGALVFINQIIKSAVEAFGPKVTGVSITIADIDVSLLDGSVTIDDLVIGNPPGYDSAYAIKVGHIGTELKISSLLSDKIIIKDITVKDVDINLDTNLITSNLTTIRDNVNAACPASDAPSEESAPKKLEIDKVDLSGLHLAVIIKGTNNGASIPLPAYYVEGLGTGSDGITGAEATLAVFTGLFDGIAKSCGNLLPMDFLKNTGSTVINGAVKVLDESGKYVTDAASTINEGAKAAGGAVLDTTKNVGDELGKGVKNVGEGAKKVGEDIGQGAKSVVKGIGDLF